MAERPSSRPTGRRPACSPAAAARAASRVGNYKLIKYYEGNRTVLFDLYNQVRAINNAREHLGWPPKEFDRPR